MTFGKYIRFQDMPSNVLQTIASTRRGEDMSALVNWGRETGFFEKTGRLSVLRLRCDRCSKPAPKQLFEVRKALKQGSRDAYCSKTCSQAHHAVKHAKPCAVCGAPARHRHSRYCSDDCKVSARASRRKQRNCPECRAAFTGFATYCSPNCANVAHSKRMRGSRNSRFTGLGRYSKLFREMAEVIRERDGHRCCNCSAPDRLIRHHKNTKRSWLQVHHVDGNSRNNVPTNLVTLCMRCHATHHKNDTPTTETLAALTANRSASMTSKLRSSAISSLKAFSPTTASS